MNLQTLIVGIIIPLVCAFIPIVWEYKKTGQYIFHKRYLFVAIPIVLVLLVYFFVNNRQNTILSDKNKTPDVLTEEKALMTEKHDCKSVFFNGNPAEFLVENMKSETWRRDWDWARFAILHANLENSLEVLVQEVYKDYYDLRRFEVKSDSKVYYAISYDKAKLRLGSCWKKIGEKYNLRKGLGVEGVHVYVLKSQ
ncbi:MAG: hypothetical protein KKD66_19885 [Proteobacteria bacterium]|nr:hypothetical protein [Pseudomonadota bacterium]MBU2451797.1 hypothetical protein [Pseudomonadota bacterium]MBU2629311.1 hypothetical protein [Pseudomonadota bacterium]